MECLILHITKKSSLSVASKISYSRFVQGILITLAIAATVTSAFAQSTNPPPPIIGRSVLLEAAGQVETMSGGATNWRPAAVGLEFQAGDRVRTRELSRAAVQLSDRSVIRLNENTTLEILPPRNAGKHRFGLPRGALYFFDREKPADVEFDTPLAAGAIRGPSSSSSFPRPTTRSASP